MKWLKTVEWNDLDHIKQNLYEYKVQSTEYKVPTHSAVVINIFYLTKHHFIKSTMEWDIKSTREKEISGFVKQIHGERTF